MNAGFYLHLLWFGLACLFLFSDMASGSEAGAPMLQANFIWKFAADRSRMIQITLVVVVLGCALLWWTR